MKASGADTGFYFHEPTHFHLTFMTDGKDVGKFYWDEERQQFVFEGDTDESAKHFIDYVTKQCQDWFEGKYGPSAPDIQAKTDE